MKYLFYSQQMVDKGSGSCIGRLEDGSLVEYTFISSNRDPSDYYATDIELLGIGEYVRPHRISLVRFTFDMDYPRFPQIQV